VCDACVRINIQLAQPDLEDDARAALETERALHMDAAIGQRRVMSYFIHDYVGRNDNTQPLPSVIIADKRMSHLTIPFLSPDRPTT